MQARSVLHIAVAALALGTPAAAAAATPSPAPSASPPGERIAIATCGRTPFYSWPKKDAAPFGADYPPATNGEAIRIIGGPQLSYGGMVLYETAIDVVDPWGAGKHYYVPASCVNAG